MGRIRLHAQQAVDIFMMHIYREKGLNARLAKKYGVSPKTIRDIWNRVSWRWHTSKYWGTIEPCTLWPGCVPPNDPFAGDFRYWKDDVIDVSLVV
jgi:hypothetical protein